MTSREVFEAEVKQQLLGLAKTQQDKSWWGPNRHIIYDQALAAIIAARDADAERVEQLGVSEAKSLCGCPMCEHHVCAYNLRAGLEGK